MVCGSAVKLLVSAYGIVSGLLSRMVAIGRTLKKYRSCPRDVEGALLLLPNWPTMTISRQTSDAIVNAIGVIIHAMRPAFPMFAALA